MENPHLRPEMDSPHLSPFNVHFRSVGESEFFPGLQELLFVILECEGTSSTCIFQGQVVQSPIKLTKDKQKFRIQFCIFPVSFLLIYTVCPSAYTKDKT